MRRLTVRQLNEIVVCPCCKQKRRQGEMMCGIAMCKYCYKDKGGAEE